MSSLEQQVWQARRRLTTNVLLQRLALGILIATGLWTLGLLTERAFVLHLPVGHGVWVAAVVAVLIALIGAARGRVNALQAAVAIDTAAGLKERVSSALAVQRDADPFARAVVRDAETFAARVHVPAHVPFHAPPLWPWSAAAVLMALILGFFMPELDLLAAPKAYPGPVLVLNLTPRSRVAAPLERLASLYVSGEARAARQEPLWSTVGLVDAGPTLETSVEWLRGALGPAAANTPPERGDG